MNRLIVGLLVSGVVLAGLACTGTPKPPKTVAYLAGEPVGHFSPRDGFISFIYHFDVPVEKSAAELEIQIQANGRDWVKTDTPHIHVSYIRSKPFTIINVIDGQLTDDGTDIQPGTEGKMSTVTLEVEN